MERWNDKALDMLEERVSDVEDQAASLVLLPERVANLKEDVDELRAAPAVAARPVGLDFKTLFGIVTVVTSPVLLAILAWVVSTR